MSVRYSIVTPTILRPSLRRLCESIDAQTEKDYEHVVIVDMPFMSVNDEQGELLQSIAQDPRRVIYHCVRRHNNYGHTCRHNVHRVLIGEYVFYVDDDDYLADDNVLTTLNMVHKDWAIFPVMHYGSYFFNDPPGLCKTGTGMFIHKKEIGRWPDDNSYEADGHFVETLRNYPYDALSVVPMVIQEKASRGI